jgi:hypothetical protein
MCAHAAVHWPSLQGLLSPVYLSVDGLVRSASLPVRDLSCPPGREVGTLPDACRGRPYHKMVGCLGPAGSSRICVAWVRLPVYCTVR